MISPRFKAVIDFYRITGKLQGKKETTIYGESHSAATFLLALQQNGIDTPEKITEEAVLSVFITSDGILRRSCSYKKSIAAVFKTCVAENAEVFNRIIAFLPELRKARKNIQYLRAEESVLIKEALKSKESGLSLRDRAVGTLAFYTGLRCCDIAGLTTNNIDWENELIHIRQQKTDVPLELPLSITVGNAVYDYLAFERPKTDREYVFISEHRPYGRLMNSSFGHISDKIMKAANIRQNAGERKGFHIFRHRVATELLGNGVPQPVISSTLGHTSPDSLEAYLSADFKHLKDCALSVERFPMPERVLNDA
jgi:integrase